jgi:hypothetical protein
MRVHICECLDFKRLAQLGKGMLQWRLLERARDIGSKGSRTELRLTIKIQYPQ